MASPEKGRFRFGLRSLFAILALVALVIWGFDYLKARKRMSTLPASIDHLRVQTNPGELPFRMGGYEAQSVGRWIQNSTPVMFGPRLSSSCEVEFILHDGPSVCVQFQVPDQSSPSDDTLYFRWENRLRRGEYSSFQKLIAQPISIADSVRNTSLYQDLNRDGVIDTRLQTLNTSIDIIWEDQDLDGRFDLEYFTDHGQAFGTKDQIDVPVPMGASTKSP